jgi:hypothetical protein
MNYRHLCAGLALFSSLTLVTLGCDSEESSSDYSDGDDTAGAQVSESDGAAAADAGDEDTSPVAPQMFESTKQLMAEQVELMATQVQTMASVAAEYKDEQLDGLLKQAKEKIAACQAKVAEVTQANSGTTLKKELPSLMEQAAMAVEKAMLRMQEAGKAKMGGGG